jgi:DNA-binding CsgD family transcriptional regulator
MSDQITEQERRAIDEAMARGAVQVIPRGTSSLPGLRYCPVQNRIMSADLVAMTPKERRAESIRRKKLQTTKALQAARGKNPPPKPVTPPHVIERREKIAAMVAQGMTSNEISAALGVKLHTIWNDANILGLTLPRKPNPETVALRAKLQEMVDAGMRPSQIAAALNEPRTRIWHHLKEMGIAFYKKGEAA